MTAPRSQPPSRTAPRRHPRGLSADGHALADGQARETLRQALHALDLAEAYQGRARALVMCEALAGVAQALAGLHACGPAEAHLAQALRWAAQLGGQDLLADLHCAWSEVAANAADLASAQGGRMACHAARERARDHAFEAARVARRVTDPNWELRLVLRASDVLERCGDHDDAVQLQQRALALMGMAQADLPADDGRPGNGPGADAVPLAPPGALM